MHTEYRSLSRIIPLLALLVGVLLIAGCSQPEEDLPLERISLWKTACNDPGLSPYLPLGVNEQIKAPALAGGAVRSGDFLISLYLICDPSLESDDPDNPEYSWQEYSEVRYLGFSYGWVYLQYPPTERETKATLTINEKVVDEYMLVSPDFPESVLSFGSGQGHYGPINTENQIVARALAAGEPIEIVLTISDSEPIAAVQLRATFEETPDGYRLLSAEFGEGDLP